MADPHELSSQLAPYIGKAVVVDVSSPYVYLGTLLGGDRQFLRLGDVDVHDLRDTSTTREEYVLTARRFGVSANRQQTLLRMEEVVGLSPLQSVLV